MDLIKKVESKQDQNRSIQDTFRNVSTPVQLVTSKLKKTRNISKDKTSRFSMISNWKIPKQMIKSVIIKVKEFQTLSIKKTWKDLIFLWSITVTKQEPLAATAVKWKSRCYLKHKTKANTKALKMDQLAARYLSHLRGEIDWRRLIQNSTRATVLVVRYPRQLTVGRFQLMI